MSEFEVTKKGEKRLVRCLKPEEREGISEFEARRKREKRLVSCLRREERERLVRRRLVRRRGEKGCPASCSMFLY